MMNQKGMMASQIAAANHAITRGAEMKKQTIAGAESAEKIWSAHASRMNDGYFAGMLTTFLFKYAEGSSPATAQAVFNRIRDSLAAMQPKEGEENEQGT